MPKSAANEHPPRLPATNAYIFTADLCRRELLSSLNSDDPPVMKVSCNRCRKVCTVARNFATTSDYRKHYQKHHKDVPLKEENETELLVAASGSDEQDTHTKENWEKTGSEGVLRKQLKEIENSVLFCDVGRPWIYLAE
jgi:hypothetical protein